MKATSYPELIMVDAAYRGEFHMPLYVLDENGQNEIIGMYLTSKEAIIKMVNTRVIMSDKNYVERLVFGDEFPDARLLLWLFHLLQTF